MPRSRPVRASIIIVTFNSRHVIDACLRSLQAHSPDAEVIIVDSLSDDGTLDYVRQHYSHVLAVSAGRNGGYGAGVNLGVSLASGNYLAILNPDTEVESGWLTPLLATLEQRADVGFVTPTILIHGTEDRVNACGNDVHLTGLTVCSAYNTPAPACDTPPRPVTAMSGAAFLTTRDVWDRLGGFDDRFFMYLEDTDLSLRARSLGYEILHVPASRVWHHYAVRIGAAKLYHLERNRLLMLSKNFAPWTLALLSPALLLTEALTWAYCVRNGRPYMRAKRLSYRRLWRERALLARARNSPSNPCHTDRMVLRSFTARLAVEQVERSVVINVTNSACTAFYAFWRGMAIALLSR